MKKQMIALIVLFFVLLTIPVVTMDRREDAVSAIDNRALTANPFTTEGLSWDQRLDALADYMTDRVGLRSDMIRLYTRANDVLFSEMVHPSYTYGQDGYVFFRNAGYGPECSDYQRDFAAMIGEMQRYCDEKGISFLFAFEPMKNGVLRDKLAVGVNYNNDWEKEFFSLLDENGVRYVDNTAMLTERTQNGEVVFNRQYNAGHWNDLGAFYGVNAMLAALQEDFPNIRLNQQEDFDIVDTLRTSLMVSEFPIHEYEPIYTPKAAIEDRTEAWCGEVQVDEQYREFHDRINARRTDTPKTLVFQGSYINGMGYKFLSNALGEYISVHDYQNVLDFLYYIDLFRPECVIFEMAEYTFDDDYFDEERVHDFRLPSADAQTRAVSDYTLTEEKGEAVTTYTLEGLGEAAFARVTVGDIPYDTAVRDGTAHLAVENSRAGEIGGVQLLEK